MKAICKFCNKTWNISIFQSGADYICPRCEVNSKRKKMLERNRDRYA